MGFLSEISTITVDAEYLYNHIDGRGSMIWGPVRAFLELNTTVDDVRFWLALH